jgi:hypothetical protein
MHITDDSTGGSAQLYQFINNEAPYLVIAMTSGLPTQN